VELQRTAPISDSTNLRTSCALRNFANPAVAIFVHRMLEFSGQGNLELET